MDGTKVEKKLKLVEKLQELDAIAQAVEDMPTFTSNDRAFLEDLPAYPVESGSKVLTATTTEEGTVLTWEEPSGGGFNLPVICAYGDGSSIGGSSAKYNYWFAIWSSSSHTIPSASARSNCTVTKVVDHKESSELAFALYLVEKTDANTGASVNEANVDAKAVFGASKPFALGEFTKSNNNIGSWHIETDKPVLLCAQSGLSDALYNIIASMQKGTDAMLARCNYSNYDNGEIHILFPEDGVIDLTFTHSTVCAYAEILPNE